MVPTQVTTALTLIDRGRQGCEEDHFHPDLCRVDDGDSAIMLAAFGERPEGYYATWFVNGRWAAWFGEPEAAFQDYFCIGAPFWFHLWRCGRGQSRLAAAEPWGMPVRGPSGGGRPDNGESRPLLARAWQRGGGGGPAAAGGRFAAPDLRAARANQEGRLGPAGESARGERGLRL
jgi:hypothetical protein